MKRGEVERAHGAVGRVFRTRDEQRQSSGRRALVLKGRPFPARRRRQKLLGWKSPVIVSTCSTAPPGSSEAGGSSGASVEGYLSAVRVRRARQEWQIGWEGSKVWSHIPSRLAVTTNCRTHVAASIKKPSSGPDARSGARTHATGTPPAPATRGHTPTCPVRLSIPPPPLTPSNVPRPSF